MARRDERDRPLAGADRTLPFAPRAGFAVTTALECSAPVVAGGVRRDELRLTGHWERYAEDAALVRSLGIGWVRYGIPFHVVAADPGRFDWAWTDRALGTLRDAGVAPIADPPPFRASAGPASLARELHARLGLPFMLAETNHDSDGAVPWLAAVWNDALALRDEGLPIRGVCWYSLTDQVDWDTALAEVNGRVNPLGLVDLERRLRPVGVAYGALARAAAEGRFEPVVAGAPATTGAMTA